MPLYHIAGIFCREVSSRQMGTRLGKDVGNLRQQSIKLTSRHSYLPMRKPTVIKLINNMWFYWMILLAISLGTAAVIYEIWLKGRI
jgi:hypothetical protein